MKSTDSHDKWDGELSAAFQAAPFPPTPQLTPVALHRLRQRRRIQRGSFIGVLLAAMVSVAIWSWPAASTDGVTAAVKRPLTDARQLELAELQVLFAIPPVDALNQLEHQQAAFLAAIGQVAQE